jgi:hypothetical protein
MGILSTLIKTGLVAGASITAYQAATVAKDKETGKINTGEFVRSFKDLAVMNSKMVVDAVKSKLENKDTGYRYSDKGENGYTYVDSEPAGDKVNEVFENMKEKAPEVIGKVQDFVEDFRDNAPEYKAKAQDFVEDVKEAAKKALDKDDK